MIRQQETGNFTNKRKSLIVLTLLLFHCLREENANHNQSILSKGNVNIKINPKPIKVPFPKKFVKLVL